MKQAALKIQTETTNWLQTVDNRRIEASRQLDPKQKSAQGQFMTPSPIASFMASLFKTQDVGEIRLLDAGAGVGSLASAFVSEFLSRNTRINQIAATTYELDPMLNRMLQSTLDECGVECKKAGIEFESEAIHSDFIEAAAQQVPLQMSFMSQSPRKFTHAILNPPYKKIHSNSAFRHHLRTIGIETTNLYTGFLAAAIKLLEPGGEMVAIVPRSFCNGPYFKPFRQFLLDAMAIDHIHIFESRTNAFKDEAVLQENIVFHATKGESQSQVTLSISSDTDFSQTKSREIPFAQVVSPNDPELFIHIAADEQEQQLAQRMSLLPCSLSDLGINVSTGPVVDFRLKEFLRKDPDSETVPLIYPIHFNDHFIQWPLSGCKKSNAIVDDDAVQKWLYPNGHCTVVRRFSSKEERRRVVAAIHDPEDVPGEKIGFENHVNVFHQNRQGLEPELAKGLAVYLNSTFFDICFRQFNGHTQVNVRDLQNLRYPDVETLKKFGERVYDHAFPSQEEIDQWIEEELFS